MRRFFFTALLFVALSAGAMAQQEEEAAAAERSNQQLRQWTQQQLLDLQRGIDEQSELYLRRLEGVEKNSDAAHDNTDRILVIFALIIVLGFFFITGNLRVRQQQMMSEVRNVTRGGEELMREIRRELARPELEYLQINHLLRRLMRQLRDPSDTETGGDYLAEIRAAARMPHLPTMLHFVARTLVAEHDGNWNTALKMLEQLREMDGKDPDVLLHLSHVHKNIALKISDRQNRNRHERLAYQYYAMFTSSVRAETLLSNMPDTPVAAPVVAAATENDDSGEAAVERKEAPAPSVASAPSSEVTEDVQDETAAERETPLSASPSKAPPVVADDSVSGKTPSSDLSSKSPDTAEATEESAAAEATKESAATEATEELAAAEATVESAAAESTEESVATETAVTEATDEKEESSVQEAKDKQSPPTEEEEVHDVTVTVLPPSSTLPAKPLVAKLKTGLRFHSAKKDVGKMASVVRAAASARWEGMLNGMRLLSREKDDDALPFMPAPAVSKVPEQGDDSTIKMWKDMRRGDQIMVRATAVKSLRERNRLIDRAAICYAQAQSHKTNKTLYHNWGLALLAKALHVAPKKRAAFYNAAVDKFLAGNVVAPHHFDFYLASLYAIIGNKDECLKWLRKARESDKLDVESLMQAPDFDSVRGESWFDEFIQR